MASSLRAKILSPTPENLRLAADLLHRGGIVAMPTETVYGLAGDAFRTEALARIFNAKERPTFDPLIIHIALTLKASRLAGLERAGLVDVSKLNPLAQERAQRLMDRFWPGPLTLVLPKLPSVSDLATAGLTTVALRMPRHSVAQALLAAAGTPLAAPSANRFGRISPTQASHVLEELGNQIELILDGGACEIGLESTVVSVSETGEVSLLRPGGISRDEIEALIGTPLSLGISGEAQARGEAAVPAPGMLESHYAPKKPFQMLSRSVLEIKSLQEESSLVQAVTSGAQKLGVLLISGDPVEAAAHLTRITGLQTTARSLSLTNSLSEAAKNLFAELRALDHTDVDTLFVEPCSLEHGIGHAIADRLKRATAKRPIQK